MTDNPVEIERKFLVAELPSLDGVDSKKIRQGYVTVPSDSVPSSSTCSATAS